MGKCCWSCWTRSEYENL